MGFIQQEGVIVQDLHSPDQIENLFQKISDMLVDYYSNPEKMPVSPGVTKANVEKQVSQMDVPNKGIGLDKTLDLFKEQVLANSVKTWHPLFLNQMSAGASVPAILGDLLSSMLNSTMATWEMTPAATIIERNVSMWMAQILGMSPGSSGIFVPGGSMANLFALTVARHNKLGPEAAMSGLRKSPKQGVIISSDSAHYSIANSANLLGIGQDYVLKIPSNDRGEMEIDELRAALKYCDDNDLHPFCVVATMGLTVTGGYDPLSEIVETCKDRNIHIHVDAAFGGGMALTDSGKSVFKGIENVDTVVWDAHKWFHVPLTCTVLLAPDAGIFKHTFSTGADYLFHPQEEEVGIADDLGHYTLLCGKRFHTLHVWMLFKAFGLDYFRNLAESRLKLTLEVYEALRADPEFTPSYQPISPIICFRYLPEGSEAWTGEYTNQLHRWVRETSKKRKLAMYNITKFKGRDHFRMILINPLTTKTHILSLLEGIKELAQEFMNNNPPQLNAPAP